MRERDSVSFAGVLEPKESHGIFGPVEEFLRKGEVGHALDFANHNKGALLVAALSAAILWLLREPLKKSLGVALESIFARVGARVHSAFARRFWLRRYRRRISEHYGRIHLSFRPTPLDLSTVFVPLRVLVFGGPVVPRKRDDPSELENVREQTSGRINASDAVDKYKQVVVVAPPGAGKSVLLRHLLVTEGTAPGAISRIPVLVELHRLSGSEVQLVGEIRSEILRRGMELTNGVIESTLRSGHMLLLLDGLDELPAARRQKVVREIQDLLAVYPECCVVITCRVAVYRDELRADVKAKLEIVEFDDDQMRQFVGTWNPGEDTRVDGLLGVIREQPRIAAIARTPLFLAMLAHLYSEAEFAIPRTRSEFCARAAELLLTPKTGVDLVHDVSLKLVVLEALALNAIKSAYTPGSDSDRVLIEFNAAVRVARERASRESGATVDGASVINEIVERSGILVREGATRLRFTHLSFRDYFVASALGSAELFKLIEEDAESSLEVARMWCGLHRARAGDVIGRLSSIDRIASLECATEVGTVDSGMFDTLVAPLIENSSGFGASQRAISALAGVAGLPAATGERTRSALIAVVRDSQASAQRRAAAADALAASGTQSAATLLVDAALLSTEARRAVRTLGDQAIALLSKRVNADEGLWALDVVAGVGSRSALEALVHWLWDVDEAVSSRAAWLLGAMLRDRSLYAAVERFSLAPAERATEDEPWVAEAVRSWRRGSCPFVVGRIVHNLSSARAAVTRPEVAMLDPRIAAAGLIKAFPDGPPEPESLRPFDTDDPAQLVAVSGRSQIALFAGLLASFEWKHGRQILRAYVNGKPLTQNDWANAYRDAVDPAFVSPTWPFNAMFFLSVFVMIAGLAFAFHLIPDDLLLGSLGWFLVIAFLWWILSAYRLYEEFGARTAMRRLLWWPIMANRPSAWAAGLVLYIGYGSMVYGEGVSEGISAAVVTAFLPAALHLGLWYYGSPRPRSALGDVFLDHG